MDNTLAKLIGLHPLISLTSCRSCGGQGKRVINGVEWPCFSCKASGTKVQQSGSVAARTVRRPQVSA